MNKRLVLLLTVAAALLPAVAQAHPLGNFTVNRYARLEPRPGAIDISYVLDLAEIPAFQEIRTMDVDGDGHASETELAQYAAKKSEAIRAGLSLVVDHAPAQLRTLSTQAQLEPGQAGLSTIRLEARYTAEVSGTEVVFRDDNEPARTGWREIVVPGSKDTSNGLRAYPEDLLSSPPDQREARFALPAGTLPEALEGRGAPAPFASRASTNTAPLIDHLTSGDLGPGAMLLAMLAAAGLGAAHALSPGHGKTIVAAYLVGSRGTVAQALLLGLTVTATHTAAVYALGGVTLLAAAYVLPERLYSWLAAGSGALVLLVGARLLITRAGHLLQHRHGHHHHHHGHNHGQDRADLRSLLALGISGGLLPCPSALMLMLSAIALQQAAIGLALTAAFSAGLAAVLVGIGTVIVLAGKAVPPIPHVGLLPRLVACAPIVGAVVVTLAGAVLTVEGLGRLAG